MFGCGRAFAVRRPKFFLVRWSLTLRAISPRGKIFSKWQIFPRQSVAGWPAWHHRPRHHHRVEVRSLSPLRSIGGRGKDGWKDKRAFSLSPPAARFANGAAATFLVDADVRSRINETFKTPGKKGRSFGVRQPGVKHRPEIINGGQDPRGWTED